MKTDHINVIGAGLAGCEAAYQLAKRGIKVHLYEMKPEKKSPAHSYDGFAELVCSNSLRARNIENAVGLLKEEMRFLDSLIMRAADATEVPAGGALAVNRYEFSDYITKVIKNDPNITVIYKEITDLSELEGITIVATGPLTSDGLFKDIQSRISEGYLHFFDAAAPIVTGESIDFSKVYMGSRYDKGDDDYINCPMTRRQFDTFYRALVTAECAEVKDFEKHGVFEGCMPVEVMAKRGYETLLYGPCKPVGLEFEDGTRPFAVVQLRKEDDEGRTYNIVGFQTHLKFPEQKRVFRLIPGLENAEFTRLGVMHRNTYINSPKLLDRFYRLKENDEVYFAGQITGVEGYVESTASGLYAAICAYQQFKGKEPVVLGNESAIGALAAYVSGSRSFNFQPQNINFSIMAEPEKNYHSKKEKREQIVAHALKAVNDYIEHTEVI